MRSNHILKLLIVSLIFVLPSCGGYDIIYEFLALRKALSQKNESASQDNRPRSDGLVTVKPPYAGLKYDKNDPHPRISLQNAIDIISTQAGLSYNRSKSFKNADPFVRQWVYPDFEDKPWREAVEELLAPYNLTYVLEGNKVVLMKPQDALRWEQQVGQVEADMAAVLQSGLQAQPLHDAVIILPLLDSQGQTTELGTLLSELAMLKATYVPQKVCNLHFPSVVELYHDYGFDRPGTSITTWKINNILRRFSTKEMAEGALEVNADGGFTIILNFNGRNGSRTFKSSGAERELHEVPQWMAQCVHQYAKIVISPTQQAYLNMPEINSDSSLFELVELERGYSNGRKEAATWSRFLKKNQDCMFAMYRHAAIHQELSITLIRERHAALPEHDLLKFLDAECYQQKEQHHESVPLFFHLYQKDYRNEALLARLDEGLLGLGMGGDAVALHELWEENEQSSCVPLLAKGAFYIDYGWDARGSGFASTVTEDGWTKLAERLDVAEQSLTKALELCPDDPRVATELIRVAVGKRYNREQMEKWFLMAVQADPAYLPAYKAKLRYLMPKWYGDRAGNDMFTFVRQCINTAPEEVNVAELFRMAHSEMAYRWADRTDRKYTEYYTEPGVWNEVKSFYDQWLNQHPDSVTDRNYYAKFAYYADDFRVAVRQFELIGKDIDKECWSEKTFYESRAESYKKAGKI